MEKSRKRFVAVVRLVWGAFLILLGIGLIVAAAFGIRALIINAYGVDQPAQVMVEHTFRVHFIKIDGVQMTCPYAIQPDGSIESFGCYSNAIWLQIPTMEPTPGVEGMGG